MALRDIPDSKLISLIDYLSKASLVLSLTALAAYLLNFWPGEWLVSFMPQIVILLLGMFMMIVTLYLRFFIRDNLAYIRQHISRFDQAVIIISFIGFIGLALISRQPVVALSEDSEGSLKVASFNALIESDGLVDGVKFLQANSADVIVLQETERSDAEFVAESMNYEFYEMSDCKCSAENSDIAVVSKHPFTTQNIYESPYGVIMLAEFAEEDLNLFAVHLSSPVSPEYFNRRNQMIELLGKYVESMNLSESNYLVVGDFNTSVYSRSIKPITDHAVVLADREWPHCTWYGYGEPLCTAIDHIFAGQNVLLHQIEYGIISGSDHRPILAEISFN